MNIFSSDAAGIGIIGGADGPTAIFVTSAAAPWELLVCAVAVAVIVLVIIIKRRKK